MVSESSVSARQSGAQSGRGLNRARERPGAGMGGATRVAECADEGVATMALFCREEEVAYCV